MSCSHPQIFNGRVVSCGCCIGCRRRQVNDWYVRLELENRLHPSASWYITLTYRPEALPKYGVFKKSDYQNYIKRVRMYFLRKGFDYKINYFMCGEFGKKNTIRPHYHLILFGIPYTEENQTILNNLWFNYCGFACVKPLISSNMKYVAKYCNKSFQSTKTIEEVIDPETGEVFQEKMVVSEFIQMSKKVPIAWQFLNNNQSLLQKYYNDKYIELNGFKYSIPKSFKYYIDKNKINIDIKKKFVFLFNEKLYGDNISKSFNSPLFSIFLKDYTDLKKFHRFDRFKSYETEFVSFKEYFNDLEKQIDRDKIYCNLHKIDYFDFYKDKYKYYFPISYSHKFFRFGKINSFVFDSEKSEKEKFWKSLVNDKKNYFNILSNLFYNNFSLLFY